MTNYLIFTTFLLLTFTSFSQDEDTPLIKTIQDYEIEKAKTLIKSGADINAEGKWSSTPIEEAIKIRNVKLVQLLLDKGASTRKGMEEAAKNNDQKMVDLLLKYDFLIGESLVYAAEHNNMEMATKLVAAGCDVNFSQKRRRRLFRKYYVSPVEFAVKNSNIEMTRLFVKHGAPLKEAIFEGFEAGKSDIVIALSSDIAEKDKLLLQAFEYNNDRVINHLVKQGANTDVVDENGNSILLLSAKAGDLIKIQRCLDEYHCSLLHSNYQKENCLMLAAESGNQSAVEYLIEKGMNPQLVNSKGENVLFYAVRSGKTNLVEYLLQHNLAITVQNTEKNTLLIPAVKSSNGQMIEFLLLNGVNIHQKNNNGVTAFYYTLRETGFTAKQDIQDLLVKHGADVNTKGPKGITLMFEAIERGNLERIKQLQLLGADLNVKNDHDFRPKCSDALIVRYLIENGVDINTKDMRGNTFLCDATQDENLELVHFLIDQGADPNRHCYFDETALIIAIRKQNMTLVKFLTENESDINAEGYFDRNVLGYAERDGTSEIVTYLRSKGARTKQEIKELYAKHMEMESELKSALVSEDLDRVYRLLGKEDAIVLQRKMVNKLAYVAAKKGNTTIINKLLSPDVDFNINDRITEKKQTLLFIATMYDQEPLVLDLLTQGADASLQDEFGNTAVDYANKKSTRKLLNKWRK